MLLEADLLPLTDTEKKRRPLEARAPVNQEPQSSLHIYLPGIMGTNQGMAPIYEQLQPVIEAHFPGAEFEGKNSFISPDTLRRPEHDRHVLLARRIVQALADHRDVHLYGHSLGAVELSQTLAIVRRMRPDWKAGHPSLERLHLTLMSPGGFGKNLRQCLEAFNRMRSIVLAGSERSGHIYGLETIAYLPLLAPDDQAESTQPPSFLSAPETSGIMLRTFINESQRGGYGDDPEAVELETIYPRIPIELTQQRFAALPVAEQQALRQIDTQIWQATYRNQSDQVKAAMTERGRLLSKYVQSTYQGVDLGADKTPETTARDAATTEPDAEASPTFRMYAQALLGAMRLVGQLVSGGTYRQLQFWRQAGVDIAFFVPEYDSLVKLSEVAEFLEEDAPQKALILAGSTHSSQGVAREMLARAISKRPRTGGAFVA